MSADRVNKGDLVRIVNIEGFDFVPGVLEYTDKVHMVEKVIDLGDFQDVYLKGVNFMMTNYDVRKVE